MRNPHGFDILLVNVKTMRKIAQIFVAFSEKLIFTIMTSVVEYQFWTFKIRIIFGKRGKDFFVFFEMEKCRLFGLQSLTIAIVFS